MHRDEITSPTSRQCTPETEQLSSRCPTPLRADSSAQPSSSFATQKPSGSQTSNACAGENTQANSNLSLSANEFTKLLESLVRPSSMTFDRNMIPIFDPTQRNQRIEHWIGKVNECAKMYNWTDEQTFHFALPKLSGHARKWYESLQTILLTWTEWQYRLIRAFPSESNYGSLLSEMLERRMKVGETVDEYFYDKMILLNACSIGGKKAVDCIIHGIDDRMLKASALSARIVDPEDLLKFLKDQCRDARIISKSQQRSLEVNTSNSNIVCFKCKQSGHKSIQCHLKEIVCFNCKEKGHLFSECPKPVIRCNKCNMFGHKLTECSKFPTNTK
ncbi:hypothetical protein ABMA27_009763 [Loxostege sticticalis]|uniref:CCHC-type domain-containing protein n=1 Tax=Loxostege sticticalis TaxID=481309 RepID=A0ABR3H6D7_LOXSC